MSLKTTRSLVAILTLVVLAIVLFGCAAPAAPTAAPAAPTTAPAAPTAAPAAGGKIKVGLSFSDFATERWKGENDLMTKLLTDKGYDVLSQQANHDVKLQNDQIDTMVSQGAKALIIIAEDGDAAVTSVDKAAKAGVKVLAYDRLIKSPNISAYISFNNTEVGRQEALGVMTALNFDSGKWTSSNPAKVFMMGGSPTDNNAILVRQGQMSVVQPYVDKGLVKIVADQFVDNWDPTNAHNIMENVLTAQKNLIDAVVASNDGTALGALQALKAQNLAGKVPISGQDATADGVNSIVKGEQTVSVFKDTRLLSPLAVKLTDEFLKGQTDPDLKSFTMAELTNDKTKQGNVMADFLPVVQVTKANAYNVVVVSGFQKYDDVYRDIPADQRPPVPAGQTSALPPGTGAVAPAAAPTAAPAAAPTAAPAAAAYGAASCAPNCKYSDMTLCFPQLGAESDWRTADTASFKETAQTLGIKQLVFSDAQQKQENQIAAVRACIQQKVNVIALPPVVEDGWEPVLTEAQNAKIPVIIVDRTVSAPTTLYAAHIGSDMVLEGNRAAAEINKLLPSGGAVLELSGTTGSGAAVGRSKGFRDKLNANIKILDSQTGDFTRAEAKPVMEAFLKKYKAGTDFQGIEIQNDDMGLGAIEALKAAGVKPGDLKIVSFDGTRGGFQAMVDGWFQADVECNPLLGPQVMDLALKLMNGQPIDREVLTNETVYYPDKAADLLPTRKY